MHVQCTNCREPDRDCKQHYTLLLPQYIHFSLSNISSSTFFFQQHLKCPFLREKRQEDRLEHFICIKFLNNLPLKTVKWELLNQHVWYIANELVMLSTNALSRKIFLTIPVLKQLIILQSFHIRAHVKCF